MRLCRLFVAGTPRLQQLLLHAFQFLLPAVRPADTASMGLRQILASRPAGRAAPAAAEGKRCLLLLSGAALWQGLPHLALNEWHAGPAAEAQRGCCTRSVERTLFRAAGWALTLCLKGLREQGNGTVL